MSLKLMKNSRFRHCEQSEAIQTKHSNSLDCFVPRNDVERYLFASFSDINAGAGYEVIQLSGLYDLCKKDKKNNCCYAFSCQEVPINH